MTIQEMFDLTGKVAVIIGGARDFGFNMADVLAEDKSPYYWGYVGKAFVYMAAYVGAALAAAVLLFQERELS